MEISGNALILIGGALASVVVLAGLLVFGFSKTLKVFEDLLMKAQSDPSFSTNLEKQFNRLEPNQQNHIRTLLSLADPLTQFTKTDVDEKTILWLRSITDGKNN